jgi:hypothetical protein
MTMVSAEALEKARVISKLVRTVDAEHVTDMLAAWMAQDPGMYVQVCLALALMAESDAKYRSLMEKAFDPSDATEAELREAHAAYARDIRTPRVVALERRYQRERKARNRPYVALRSLRAKEDVA